MKPKKTPKKLRITQEDYMLAQRRAARMRSAVHRSKKVYDRKRLKKAGLDLD